MATPVSTIVDERIPPYADDWLKVARRDWHRLHVLLRDGDADVNYPKLGC